MLFLEGFKSLPTAGHNVCRETEVIQLHERDSLTDSVVIHDQYQGDRSRIWIWLFS